MCVLVGTGPVDQKNLDIELDYLNHDIWRSIIEQTQTELFAQEWLDKIGELLRDNFLHGGPEGSGWRHIPEECCRFQNAHILTDVCSGYDIPLTFTPSGEWNGDFVGLVAQDPLRQESWFGNILSVCAPWGFEKPPAKPKGGAAKIWPLVNTLTDQGYGVYVTDIYKLYAKQDRKKLLGDIIEREERVFEAERRVVDPKLWVCFGRQSQVALRKHGVANGVDRHPHPAAWGQLKKHYGTETETVPDISAAIISQVLMALAKV